MCDLKFEMTTSCLYTDTPTIRETEECHLSIHKCRNKPENETNLFKPTNKCG